METALSFPIEMQSRSREPGDQSRALMLSEALLAVSSNRLDDAAAALSRFPDVASRDAACLNLTGVICQQRGQWSKARRFYGRAFRADRGYSPAEQNLRR